MKTPLPDRDASTYLQIAQFCNYLQSNESDGAPNSEILTLLTGDNINDIKSSQISYSGIMQAVSVNFMQITNFYAKYKKK